MRAVTIVCDVLACNPLHACSERGFIHPDTKRNIFTLIVVQFMLMFDNVFGNRPANNVACRWCDAVLSNTHEEEEENVQYNFRNIHHL